MSDSHITDLRLAAAAVEDANQALKNAKLAREATIREVAAAGASYREIAEHSGVSYQRVAQLLTGEPAAGRPFGIAQLVRCPKCEAAPGEPCIDRFKKDGSPVLRGASWHADRHSRAWNIFEGDIEPEAGEPHPLAPIYSAIEKIGIGKREVGPIVTDEAQAAAYLAERGLDGYVGMWGGTGWVDVSS